MKHNATIYCRNVTYTDTWTFASQQSEQHLIVWHLCITFIVGAIVLGIICVVSLWCLNGKPTDSTTKLNPKISNKYTTAMKHQSQNFLQLQSFPPSDGLHIHHTIRVHLKLPHGTTRGGDHEQHQ